MRKYRFTLAEDDSDTLFLLHTLLSMAFPQSSISSFSNAEDALRHILNSGTDVLITDHGMGLMSGTEMIRQLRSQGIQIPIIVVSGDPRIEQEARLAGATEFLEKNFSAKDFEAHIRKLLPG